MRAWSLKRAFLASAAAVAVLPFAAYLAIVGVVVPRQQLADIAASVQIVANSVALEVERYIEMPRRQILSLVDYMSSARGALGESDGKAIGMALDAIARANTDFADVLVLDAAGRIVAASTAKSSRLGEDLSGEPAFKEARAGGELVFSDPFISPGPAGMTIGAFKRAGELTIAAHIKLESLSGLLVPLMLSPRDRIAVVDRWGFAIAHSDLSFVREQRRVEIPGPGIAEAREGGGSWLATSRPIPRVGWTMVYLRDRRDALALTYRLRGYILAVAAASLVLSQALSPRLLAGIARPFDDLLARIRAMASGRYDGRIEGSYAEEFGRIAEAFNSMADNVRDRDRLISRDLEEKTVLLREVHHRVKNNLQVMSSLLHLEERFIRDPADAELFASSQSRIYSMSLTHEILYQSESLSRVRLDVYARSLVSFLCGAYALGSLRAETDCDGTSLPLEEAQPFGLVLNELVTNALKYAVKGAPDPYLGVSIRSKGGFCELEVRDRGPGLPPREEGPRSRTLGYSLIRSLTAQLDGEIRFEPAFPGQAWPGVLARLRFPFEDEAR